MDKKHHNDWYLKTVEEIFSFFKTSINGLSDKDAVLYLKKYGENKLPEEKKTSPWKVLLDQIKSPLIYILIIAAFISFLFDFFNHGNFTDAIVISVAVILNVVIGFVQERKTQKTLESLKKTVVSYTTVRRDGVYKNIETKNLVCGDIVVLDVGDKVPADCRIIEQQDLLVDESALTGESVAVEKTSDVLKNKNLIVSQQQNMLFMGTVVVQGKVKAVVVETGVRTELGKIAQMLAKNSESQTPLQKKMADFSKKISIIVLFVALFIFLLGFIKSSFDLKNIILFFETSIAVSVAAIPEGLAVAVTVILVVGMQRILKHKALVRRLLAAEVLGSTTVICTDKTGTLTKGQMQVECIESETKLNIENKKMKNIPESITHLIMNGILCNDSVVLKKRQKVVFEGTPTEKALLEMAYRLGFDIDKIRKKNIRIDEIAFNSENKYMIVLAKNRNDEKYIYIKGAMEKILDYSSFVFVDGKKKRLTEKHKDEILEKAKLYSKDGKRILSFGFKTTDKNSLNNTNLNGFVFLGFVVISDPLRKTVKHTIDVCKKAGIKVIMITGDHYATAKAIAKQIGIPHSLKNILTGNELSKMTDEELDAVVDNVYIYARVVPEDKLRIINSLQKKKEVVAMTGDGVNDAPALKQADIGVALGSGTEVAKDASDMILLDNNFSTIVSAVREGRAIYDNIKKVILYFISDSFASVVAIILALIGNLPLPIIVAQILYINLINDSMPALSLTQDPPLDGIMKQSPQERDRPVLDGIQQAFIGVVSFMSGILAILIFVYMWRGGLDIEYTRTLVFSFLSLKSLFYIFSVRDIRKPLWKTNIFNNKYVNMSFLAGIMLQIIAVYTPFMQRFLETVPLSLWDWMVIVVFCLVIVFMVEVVKMYFSSRYGYQKS